MNSAPASVPLLAPSLPTWEELRFETLAHCSKVGELSPRLTKRWLHLSPVLVTTVRWLAAGLSALSRLGRLRTWAPEELGLFVLQQIYLNSLGSSETETTRALMFGAHSQLPCTHASLQRRLAVVCRFLPKSAPILIIGDDDMQSIGLARQGYTDITVIELDEQIARCIRDISQAERLNVRVRCGNIQEVGSELGRKYGATLVDPPTDVAGLEVFLSGVSRLNVLQPDSYLFLSTNLLAHQRNGYEVLRARLMKEFSLRERHVGINFYTVPRIPRAVFNFCIALVERSFSRGPIRYYCADLLVFRSKRP